MWLKNGVLGVFFDERRGGMPTKDNLGFIRAAAVEIAYAWPPPFFQSLNDRRPSIKKYSDSKLVASGVMRRGAEVTPHTYEMTATLDENRLNLSYKLSAARTEKVMRSKIWVWLAQGRMENWGGRWNDMYIGKQPKTTDLFGGRLRISGSTIPPAYARVCRLEKYPKFEIVYGWTEGLLKEGTYTGDLTLTYGGEGHA